MHRLGSYRMRIDDDEREIVWENIVGHKGEPVSYGSFIYLQGNKSERQGNCVTRRLLGWQSTLVLMCRLHTSV